MTVCMSLQKKYIRKLIIGEDMNNKEAYIELCSREKTIPIFLRHWWLDVVKEDGEWDVIIEKKGENIIAAFPFYYKNKFGIKYITQPILTQKTGLWIKYPVGQSYTRKLSYEKEIMINIIEKLEALHFQGYKQHFDYSITNWLPFYWKGYSQTTRYTYVLEDISNIDKVLLNFASSKRKNIKKAEKIVEIRYDLSAEEFYANHKMTLKKQGENILYSFEVFNKIYNACYERNNGRVFYAVDNVGNIHCALFIVWDEISAYYLISTIDPEYRNVGAASLTISKAIKYVANYTKKFDFEGSMIENVENSYRRFGAVQVPYFCIYKEYSRLFKMLNRINKIVKR